MTRGNQREIDRARAAARHAGKGTKSEGDPLKKREDDGNALKAKLEAKAAKAAAEKEAAEAKAKFEEERRKASGGADDGGTAKVPATEPGAAAGKKKKKPKEDLSFLDDIKFHK